MKKIFEFFFFVAFEAYIAIDSEIFYSFNALFPSELLIKRSPFISRGVYRAIVILGRAEGGPSEGPPMRLPKGGLTKRNPPLE